MNFKKLTIAFGLLLNSTLFANTEVLKTLSKEEAAIDVARVQAAFTLEKPASREETRVNLVVEDNGGSTDVSPTISLYLVFWKDGEMGDATASFSLGATYSLIDYSYSKGKLTLKLKELGDQGFETKTVKINFTDFRKHFEKEAESVEEEFGVEWVEGSITKGIL